MLEMKNVEKSFSGKAVLRGATLASNGETVALMGESGSGKTTVLRILASLEKADAGQTCVTGKTAVVFAEPRLFENKTVLENITCVMDGKKAENERRARELLLCVGLDGTETKRAGELSSGMAARVSICRALAANADNYLFDEPFKALDEGSRENVMIFLKKELDGKSAVLITHDKKDADFLCSKTYHLGNGTITLS